MYRRSFAEIYILPTFSGLSLKPAVLEGNEGGRIDPATREHVHKSGIEIRDLDARTEHTVITPPPQQMSHIMQARQKTSEEPQEVKALEALDVDPSLCQYCRKLIGSFFAQDKEYFNTLWEEVRSEHSRETIRCFRRHYDGKTVSLLTSADAGCSLCALFYVSSRPLQLRSTDFNIVQYRLLEMGGKGLSHGMFHISYINPSELSEDEIHRKRSASTDVSVLFNFYRRNGEETNWKYFSQQRKSTSATGLSNARLIPGWRGVRRVASRRPSSDEALQRVQRWYTTCVESHPKCQRSRVPLPARVLDLAQLSSSGLIFLYLSAGEVEPYATLSYCWGDGLPLKTTTTNLSQHCRGIQLQSLPRTLCDGVRVASFLGLQYLWIDALCILQDDVSDWAVQASLMTEIYEGSSLNISALSAKNCDSGFLMERAETLSRVGTYRYPANSMDCGDVFVGRTLPSKNIDDELLCTRGWAFQERLVSIASLHYTSRGILWECVSEITSETGLAAVGSVQTGQWKDGWADFKPKATTVVGDQVIASLFLPHDNRAWALFHRWHTFVSTYSRRKLTRSQDRLPAVAGIARSIATNCGWQYLAGLWRENILSDMFWSRAEKEESLLPSDHYRAPSWSWASIDGEIHYTGWYIQNTDPRLDLDISTCEVEEVQRGTFGQVRSGRIEATGWIQHIIIKKSTKGKAGEPLTALRGVNSNHCTIGEGVIAGVTVSCIIDIPDEVTGEHSRDACLRLGVFDKDGRDSVAVLLIRPTEMRKNEFRRIGIGETLVWSNNQVHGINYDIFEAGMRAKLILV